MTLFKKRTYQKKGERGVNPEKDFGKNKKILA